MITYEQALHVTKDNVKAAWFLVDFVELCHMFDDVVDKDKPVTDAQLVSKVLKFIEHFAVNDWARATFPQLFPLVVSAFNGWLDSNIMAKSDDVLVRLSSDTIKGLYHEVVYAVAYLCGGFEHMRSVSTMREYDYDLTKGKL